MLFDELTKEEKAAIEKIGVCRKFVEGGYIVKEGEKGASLFIIRSGTAEVRKVLNENNYKHLKNMEAGEFFGEMSFLGNVTRSASVVALEECDVIELDANAFESLAEKQPSIGLRVYRNIAKDLAGKLRRDTEDLKKALLWAIHGMEI